MKEDGGNDVAGTGFESEAHRGTRWNQASLPGHGCGKLSGGEERAGQGPTIVRNCR